METFLTILEITIPSVIVFLCAFFMMKKMQANTKNDKNDATLDAVKAFLDAETMRNESLVKLEHTKMATPLRMQAYERLVLLLERIKPESILLRVQTPQMTAAQLHQDLLITIRAEFEHNLSQQIYVSELSWNAVKLAKDDLVRIINEESEKVATVAPAMSLSQAIVKASLSQSVNRIDVALALLKKEAENYL